MDLNFFEEATIATDNSLKQVVFGFLVFFNISSCTLELAGMQCFVSSVNCIHRLELIEWGNPTATHESVLLTCGDASNIHCTYNLLFTKQLFQLNNFRFFLFCPIRKNIGA